MKTRMKKALAVGTVVVLLLLAGGYWALHALQERMTAALASLAEEAPAKSRPVNDPEKRTDPAHQAPASKQPPVSQQQLAEAPKPTSGQDSVRKPGDSPVLSGKAEQAQSPAQAPATVPQAAGKPSDPKSGSTGYKAEISEGKAKEVQDQISLAEQVKITTVLLKKLDGNDLKQLQNMFKQGVSLEDKRKAKAMILEKLSEEEYDELIAIASKYGLSKGKSYEESLQEKK
ncbi:hypothetical protein SAMN04487970_104536 [Paenibacillus tianmuensis]|uniref:Uncharacterized protein n=1 Tax=Paenibacillus tianmuensis TaxID=624147 RepID=A0A1G4T969_9BACL|nr:hypothetical protein [Paenibacillus tianmuensis]SCW77861.1 hypothetical protein SAMN04487970_104536 [Paenibacillus tianmuensis]